MTTTVVQTSYGNRAAAYAGEVVDQKRVGYGAIETAAGIEFGLVVEAGSAAGGIKVGTGGEALGILKREINRATTDDISRINGY